MELPKAICAILFYQAEPLSIKRLSALLKCTEGAIRDAVPTVEASLATTGLCLIQNDNELTLGTAPEASSLIETITKEELSKELSKSSLETLAIVLYKGPITRSEIDYIRGVNSTFILRNLLIRGLVEKVENPNDQRSYLYKPTFSLLEYMGIKSIDGLPDYEATIATLSGFSATMNDGQKEGVKEPTAPDAEDNTTALSDDAIESEPDTEADIAEEDLTGNNYDDEELVSHLEEDRFGEEQEIDDHHDQHQ